MTITPFRYPGAKNKLLPILINYIDEMMIDQNNFVDLFVGGGSVLLEVASKYPNIQLHANDKNYWMFCFWKIVSGDDAKKFEQLLELVEVVPTLELFYKLREAISTDDVECARRAIFFNRTTFSGIFNSGPIGGKEQKSKYPIDCRYNVKKLQNKIVNCRELLIGRTTVTGNDFSECKEFIDTNYPVYLDPPYVEAGKSLYTKYMVEEEHRNLGKILSNRKKWILSYDDNKIIREIYQNCDMYNTNGDYCINGAKTTWSQKSELIIIPK